VNQLWKMSHLVARRRLFSVFVHIVFHPGIIITSSHVMPRCWTLTKAETMGALIMHSPIACLFAEAPF
jgi:hypothetical protein